MKIAFVDLETTGLDFIKHETIQISGVLVDNATRKTVEELNVYIESLNENSPGAQKVNGYYKGKWKDLGYKDLDSKKNAETVFRFISQADTLISHNSAFDRPFLTKFMVDQGYDAYRLPKYFMDDCTLAWILKYKTEGKFLNKISLDYLVERFDITADRNKHHDALEDSKLLSQVFYEMIDKIQIKI